MLISFCWLQRHIDLQGLDAERVAADLTLHTAEVEGVERLWPHAEQVLVGEVLEREPHPSADRLSKCLVSLGAAEPVPIVCGAPNVAAGQKVPVALPGTHLPGIGKLKKSKIRGEVSLGMICSEQELGLGDEHDGIWVLPPEAVAGSRLSDAVGLVDWAIDIDNKSLTHRPDLWGHRGIARELSAIYQRPLTPLEPQLPSPVAGVAVPVEVATAACSRYLAMPLSGARSLPSPLWLRRLLAAVGQRSLGQLVDISNFVMLDLGQPNHVFDGAQIAPEGIVVRAARPSEAFRALDGTELSLTEQDVVVTSGGRPAALAGVIGGHESEVEGDTRSVVLEVATFDAATVRRTSTRHGLRTDSSARFEKSLDPRLPALAAAHFVTLLRQLQPEVRCSGPATDCCHFDPAPLRVSLRPESVRRALGVELSDEAIGTLLQRLQFDVPVQLSAQGCWSVGVPSFRATKDIAIERDLVEEVGRLYGYGRIEERALLAPVAPPPPDDRRALVRRVQDRLSGAARFTETIGYSFQSDEVLRALNLLDQSYCRLSNPVVAGESRMRRSLVPSLLGPIEAWRRGSESLRLYEVGKCYLPNAGGLAAVPQEQHRVALLWAGPPPAPGAPFSESLFFRLYGVVQDLMAQLERPQVVWQVARAPERTVPAWAHPRKCLQASMPGSGESEPLGTLCSVHPQALNALGLQGRLRSEVVVCDLSLDGLVAMPRTPRVYQPLPRFPGVKLDVAIAAPVSMPAASVTAAIEQAAGDHCRGVELFDVYHGESLGSDQKSLAFHVLLQSSKKTLSDSDEQRFLKKLGAELGRVGAHLRDG